MKRIIFTVTNDLNYDQRMQRICGSLASAGYAILLIGYTLKNSKPLAPAAYKQKRINCLFKKGKLFYTEYNIRLLFYMLFKKADCFCAIDLDTILPCWLVSKLKGAKRVYDAHEYFSQLDEVVSRPVIYRLWHWIEKKMIPRFEKGYTVCQSLADEFLKNYGVKYEVIRNVPVLFPMTEKERKKGIILYQGAVNKGRGLDKLAEAMKITDGELRICGDGNFMNQLKEVIQQNGLMEKIKLFGMLPPAELRLNSAEAYIAVNPFERQGMNQYLSLSNKFFDYIQAGLPQVTMNYPEYRNINNQWEVAVLIDDLNPETIAVALNNLLSNDVLYNRLKQNCMKARETLNWQAEQQKLIAFYANLFA